MKHELTQTNIQVIFDISNTCQHVSAHNPGRLEDWNRGTETWWQILMCHHHIPNIIQIIQTITINKSKFIKTISQPISRLFYSIGTNKTNFPIERKMQQYSTLNLKISNLNLKNLSFKISIFSSCSLLRYSWKKNLFYISGATELEPRCVNRSLGAKRRTTKYRNA